MGVDQRTRERTNPHIPLVVSKSHRNQGTVTTAHRTLGLMPADTMCRSNLSEGFYPILSTFSVFSLSNGCQKYIYIVNMDI